jgi:hypothetical protein
VLFSILLGMAALVFLAFFAAVLTAGIYFVLPHLQHTFAAIPLRLLLRELLSRRKVAEVNDDKQDPVIVVLGRDVLAQTKFLVGMANGRLVFDSSRKTAKRMHLNDTLALRAWLHLLEERHGMPDVFILYAKQEKP